MTAIVLAFIGNLLLVIPDDYISAIGGTVSFILLVAGVCGIMNYIGSSRRLIHYIKLAGSLFVVLFGVMLVSIEGMFVRLLLWMVGTAPVIMGFYGIYHAIMFARRSGRRGWWLLIILSGLLLIFGTVVFMNPWHASLRATMQVIGGALMYSSFVSLLELIFIWPIKSGEGE